MDVSPQEHPAMKSPQESKEVKKNEGKSAPIQLDIKQQSNNVPAVPKTPIPAPFLSAKDMFILTRDERIASEGRQINQAICITRSCLLAVFSLYAVNCLANIIMEFISIALLTSESAEEVSVVLSFNFLMLIMNVMSVIVFSTASHQQSLPVNFILVIHAIIVFFEFISVFSTIGGSYGSRDNKTTEPEEESARVVEREIQNSLHLTPTTTTSPSPDSLFDMGSESGYQVPAGFVVYGTFYGIIHIIATILIDYVRRLNTRRANLHQYDPVTSSQEEGHSDDTESSIANSVKPAQLMEYAAKSPVSPSTDKSSPSSIKSSPSPSHSPQATV